MRLLSLLLFCVVLWLFLFFTLFCFVLCRPASFQLNGTCFCLACSLLLRLSPIMFVLSCASSNNMCLPSPPDMQIFCCSIFFYCNFLTRYWVFFPVTFAVLVTILDSALLTLKFMFSTGLLKCLPPFLTLFFQFAFSFSPVVFQLDLRYMIMETTYNIVRARWTVITRVRYAYNSGVRQRCSFMG